MKKFECPRVCYDTQDDSKVLGIEEATPDEDISEEGDDLKSKERIEVHDS